MNTVIKCECGEFIRGASDDELVAEMEQHLSDFHPELAGQISRDDMLRMAEAPPTPPER